MRENKKGVKLFSSDFATFKKELREARTLLAKSGSLKINDRKVGLKSDELHTVREARRMMGSINIVVMSPDYIGDDPTLEEWEKEEW